MTEMVKKMSKGGYCYFSTAANAPAEDHILLFTTTGEIRDLIRNCGWKIINEQIFTLNEMSVEKAEKNAQSINYCAVLQAE